jgi:hypothetical protein
LSEYERAPKKDARHGREHIMPPIPKAISR